MEASRSIREVVTPNCADWGSQRVLGPQKIQVHPSSQHWTEPMALENRSGQRMVPLPSMPRSSWSSLSRRWGQGESDPSSSGPHQARTRIPSTSTSGALWRLMPAPSTAPVSTNPRLAWNCTGEVFSTMPSPASTRHSYLRRRGALRPEVELLKNEQGTFRPSKCANIVNID